MEGTGSAGWSALPELEFSYLFAAHGVGGLVDFGEALGWACRVLGNHPRPIDTRRPSMKIGSPSPTTVQLIHLRAAPALSPRVYLATVSALRHLPCFMVTLMGAPLSVIVRASPTRPECPL